MTTKLVQYAVVFEPFETEGLEYVKQGCGAMWDDKSPVKVFDTQEDAQKEADKWNTGQVVQYFWHYKMFSLYIKEHDHE